MHWKPYEASCKWAVVVQKFHSDQSEFLNLNVGDMVYIRRCCSDWFYGFAAGSKSFPCGAFPKICVHISRRPLWSELDAELQIMSGYMILMYKNVANFRLDQVSSLILKALELKISLGDHSTEYEAVNQLKNFMMCLVMTQRELDLPVLLRTHNFVTTVPYSEVLVDLHQKHLSLFRSIKDTKSNIHSGLISKPFCLRLHFGRLPSAEFTIYLASQSISIMREATLVGSSTLASDSFEDSSADGMLTTPVLSGANYHLGSQINRLTDNVVISGYDQSSNEVMFTQLDPIQPREERILLILLAHRVGYMHSKRQRTGSKSLSSFPPAKSSNQVTVRRPYGVACVDITRDLLHQVRARSDHSGTQHTKRSNSGARLITVTPTSEQFQSDALLQLIKDTPLSFCYNHPSREPSATQSASATTLASGVGLGFPSLNTFIDSQCPDNMEFDLDVIEVLNPLQTQIWTGNNYTGRSHCGLRYGLPRAIFEPGLPYRHEIFINLISGDFFKGPKKQEKNVEVEISLRDNYGNLWPACEPFHSTVYYHKNHPRWSELFAVSLPSLSTRAKMSHPLGDVNRLDAFSTPPDTSSLEHAVPGALVGDHLRFVCRHRSTSTASKDKLVGVAFLRLQPSTSIPVLLADGIYQLLIHKMDTQMVDSCAYLREASFKSGPGFSDGSSGSQGSSGATVLHSSPNLSGFAQSKQRHETLCVESRLCSHEHTTDEHLAKVLFWKRYQDDLVMCLRQGIYLSRKDVELRKFTRPLFDCLIQILASTTTDDEPSSSEVGTSLGYSVLMALARCYRDLLINQPYQELFTAYLKSPSFAYHKVYQPYLCTLNSVLRDQLEMDLPDTAENGNRGTSTEAYHVDGKAVQLILSRIYWAFLVIVRSRQLEQEHASTTSADASNGTGPSFTQQMDLFFNRVTKVILFNKNQLLRPTLLKSVPEILKDVLTVYPASRLACTVAELIRSTLDFAALPNHIIVAKAIESDLFSVSESRKILLPVVFRSLTTFFAQSVSKELKSGRTETDLRMECWSDLLLSFTSRLVQVGDGIRPGDSVPSKQQSHNWEESELYYIVVTEGFLRWTMQQLARILIHIRHEERISRSSASSDEQWSPQRRINRASLQSDGCGTIPSSFHRLQPVMGCLTSVLLTLFQPLDHKAWWTLLIPSLHSTETVTSDACCCNVCSRLQLMDLYDMVHELLSIFILSHRYPPYHSPIRSDPIATDTAPLSRNHSINSPNDSSGRIRLTDLADSWIEMLAASSNVELHVLQVIIDLALRHVCFGSSSPETIVPDAIQLRTLTPDHSFSTDLVVLMLQCLTSFAVDQAHLNMEALPSVLRLRVDRSLSGHDEDMRQRAVNLLLSIWNFLGDQHKVRYVTVFLPRIIDLATIPIPSLRQKCVDWILGALRVSPSLIERDFVSEVDRVMQWAGTSFAAEICRLLEDCLSNLALSSQVDKNALDIRQQRLLGDLIRQVKCLLAYGEFLNHSSKLNEMLALHNLRAVYEKNGRTDMMLRYLYRLESLHAKCGNDVERGYTLESISRQYTWSDDAVDGSNVSQQYVRCAALSSLALRERLLLDSLECLKKGTDWERAIEVCAELADLYRVVSPNYTKLSSILSEQSDLYQRIVSSQHVRTPFYYYLLIFNGPGFASFIVDRFVYRTAKSSFEVNEMLSEEFPQATRVTVPPTPGYLSDHPTIFASGTLRPQAILPDHLVGHGVDSRIKSYYLRNRISCFTHLKHNKPVVLPDGREKPCAEETRYYVDSFLPGIMPIVPVIRSETITLDPIQLATIQVEDIISRLEQHTPIQSESPDLRKLNPLIGLLTSSISSPQSGGLPALLASLELSDDIGQETNFSKLSDCVLDLLEQQLSWLEFWYKAHPPPSRTAGSTGNEHLQKTVEAYEILVRDMSRKFGFSVSHLKAEHLRFGPSTSVTERRSSLVESDCRQLPPQSLRRNMRIKKVAAPRPRSAQPSTTRAFQRSDGLATPPANFSTLRSDRSRLGSRSGADQFLTADFSWSRMLRVPIDSTSLILSSDPPPLPDRPMHLSKPNSFDYLLYVDNEASNTPKSVAISLSTSSSPRPSFDGSSDRLVSDLLTVVDITKSKSEVSMARRPPVPSRANSVARTDTEKPLISISGCEAPPLPPRPLPGTR